MTRMSHSTTHMAFGGSPLPNDAMQRPRRERYGFNPCFPPAVLLDLGRSAN